MTAEWMEAIYEERSCSGSTLGGGRELILLQVGRAKPEAVGGRSHPPQ